MSFSSTGAGTRGVGVVSPLSLLQAALAAAMMKSSEQLLRMRIAVPPRRSKRRGDASGFVVIHRERIRCAEADMSASRERRRRTAADSGGRSRQGGRENLARRGGGRRICAAKERREALQLDGVEVGNDPMFAATAPPLKQRVA